MSDTQIKAIETHYKGYRFRSRLEARWAVFFDAIGIDWEYEKEGYQLPCGNYLPDFWLPSFSGGMFAEVKPEHGAFKDIMAPDWDKAISLCLITGKPVWCCDGAPEFREYVILEKLEGRVQRTSGVPLIDQAIGENRMYWMPSEVDMQNEMRNPISSFREAINAARSARFEFGESG